MKGQLETAHLFRVTHNFKISRNSPPQHFFLSLGSQFLGRKRRTSFSLQTESCSKHTSDPSGKSLVQEREPGSLLYKLPIIVPKPGGVCTWPSKTLNDGNAAASSAACFHQNSDETPVTRWRWESNRSMRYSC